VNQDRVKKDQEHQDLYWFTLPQELHPVSLLTSKENSLKNAIVQLIQQELRLAPYKNTPQLCNTLLHYCKHKPYTLVEQTFF